MRSLVTDIDHALDRQVRSQHTNIRGHFTQTKPWRRKAAADVLRLLCSRPCALACDRMTRRWDASTTGSRSPANRDGATADGADDVRRGR